MNKFYVLEGIEGEQLVYIGFDDEGTRLAYLHGAYFYTDREDAEYDCLNANRDFKPIKFVVKSANVIID